MGSIPMPAGWIWLPASSTCELEPRDLIGWAQARPKRGEWEACLSLSAPWSPLPFPALSHNFFVTRALDAFRFVLEHLTNLGDFWS